MTKLVALVLVIGCRGDRGTEPFEGRLPEPPAQLELGPDDGSAKPTPLATGERIERIPTRDGITLPVLVVEPKAPVGIVVLFPGGTGVLGLGAAGIAQGADNFVVRTRQRYADAGFVAIVVDAPSDQGLGMNEFRISAEHAVDVTRLVAWARARWPVPVWLVGTSRGTISAANAAVRGVPVAGLVLTSAVTEGDRRKVTLRDLRVGEIRVPTWFVHHQHDACNASPLHGAQRLATQLTAPVEWKLFDGGAAPTGKPCSPDSAHGFLGLDADVVGYISSRN